jgi:hypothetical protein
MGVRRADTPLDLRYDVNNDGKVTSADALLLSKGTPLRTDISSSAAQTANTQTAQTASTQSSNNPTFADLTKAYNQKGATTTTSYETEAGTQYDTQPTDLGNGWMAWEKPAQIIGYEGSGESATPIYSKAELGGFSRKDGDIVNFYDLEGKVVHQQNWDEGDIKTIWNDIGNVVMAAATAGGLGGTLGSALLGEGATQIASNALGGALLGGGGAALGGGNVLQGALLGGAGGAISGYLNTDTTGATGSDVGQVSSSQAGSSIAADTAAATDLAQNLIDSGVSTSEAARLLDSVGFDQSVTNSAVNNVVTLNQVVDAISTGTGETALTGGADTISGGADTGVSSQISETQAATDLAQNLVDSGLSTSETTQLLNSVGFDQNVTVNAVNNVVTLNDVVNTIAQNTSTGADTVTGGVDYSLSSGQTNLEDMGGAQGLRVGTSQNLTDMGGAQGITLNLGGQSTTVGDAINTFGGSGASNLSEMGGGQGLTLQTDSGLVTQGGTLNIGGLTGNTDVIGQTGVNTATNIGTGIGTDLAAVDTGVNTSSSTGTPATKTYTLAEVTELIRLGLLGAGIVAGANAGDSGPTRYDIVPVPADWKSPVYQKDLPPTTPTQLPPIDFGTRDLLKGTQWEKFLDPNYGKIPEPKVYSQPSQLSYQDLMGILGSKSGMPPASELTINDVISGIQNQYGQTP